MGEEDQGQRRGDQKTRGYEHWRKPAQDLLKRGILALVLDHEPNGLTLAQLKRCITGSVEDASHHQSVDSGVQDLISDGLLEEDASEVIRATKAASAFDRLGL